MNSEELIKLMEQVEKKGLEWEAVEQKIKVSHALLELYGKSGPVPVTIINNLKKVLPQVLELLKPKGRLAVISFHSGEDRIVKRFLKTAAEHGDLLIITDKPVRPTAEEIEKNPRSRSAKLRVGEKR